MSRRNPFLNDDNNTSRAPSKKAVVKKKKQKPKNPFLDEALAAASPAKSKHSRNASLDATKTKGHSRNASVDNNNNNVSFPTALTANSGSKPLPLSEPKSCTKSTDGIKADTVPDGKSTKTNATNVETTQKKKNPSMLSSDVPQKSKRAKPRDNPFQDSGDDLDTHFTNRIKAISPPKKFSERMTSLTVHASEAEKDNLWNQSDDEETTGYDEDGQSITSITEGLQGERRMDEPIDDFKYEMHPDTSDVNIGGQRSDSMSFSDNSPVTQTRNFFDEIPSWEQAELDEIHLAKRQGKTAVIVDDPPPSLTTDDAADDVDGDDSGWGRVARKHRPVVKAEEPAEKPVANASQVTEEDLLKVIEERIRLKAALEELHKKPHPVDTVRRMLSGQPVLLERYRSIEDKRDLLKQSEKIGSGSVIVRIVVFLERTLNAHVFHASMRTRKRACKMYGTYLKRRREWDKLINFLGHVGCHEEASLMMFQHALGKGRIRNRLSAVQDCASYCEMHKSLENDVIHLNDYAKLLELQGMIEQSDSQSAREIFQVFPRNSTIPFQSALATLYYCGLYHDAAPKDSPSHPTQLRKNFRMTEKQFTWSMVGARSHAQDWEGVERLVMGKTVFRKALKLKSCISAAGVSLIVSRNNAPLKVIEKYLSLIPDAERKYKLAEQCHADEVAVEALIELKEEDRLRAYALRPSVRDNHSLSVRVQVALKGASKWQ